MSDELPSVLVVEDDENMRDVLRELLELRGFDTRVARTGAEALESARSAGPPAVAIVDIHLPDADGIGLLAELRDISGLTELVVLTGQATVDSAVRAMRERSHDYLIKPVDPDRIVESVERAFERWRRKSAERERAESERRLRGIFAAIVDAVFVTDGGGRIQDANPAAEELTGRSLAALRALGLGDLLSEHGDGVPTPGPAPSLDGATDGEFVLERAEGKPRIVEVRSRHFGADRTVHSVRDITLRRGLEEQLYRAQRMEAVGQLAGGLAHDFNNVLMAIGGYADLLTPELADRPHALDDLNEIIRCTERAAHLTQQLLAFSRRQVLNPRVLDPNEVVVGLERMLHGLMHEGVELGIELEEGVGTVRADRPQLEQVIVNLVTNARDAMPEGGRLTIRTSEDSVRPEQARTVSYDLRPGEYVVLEVEDTGDGMDARTLSRAFEPFYSTGRDEGSGLGLATAYGIVKQSGGYIWAESSLGDGARFRVYLPRLAEPAEEPGEVAPDSTRGMVGAETVLISEPDHSVREFMRRSLEAQGYEVLTAAGAGAVEAAQAHDGALDLLMVDCAAGEQGARETARRIAEAHPSVRLILTSMHSGEYPGEAEGESAGTGSGSRPLRNAPILPKPFSSNELLRTVREVLDGSGSEEG